MSKLTRRAVGGLGAAALTAVAVGRARAEEKFLTIGMSVPLTGTLAQQAGIVSNAARFAVNEANEKGGVAGYRLKLLLLDDGSPITGQYDPALSATNARRMLNDPSVIAAVGPLNSGSAKAMCPVFSQGDMAFISGSATNPDLNNPKFFPVYHPAGKPNFFRTVTTDAYQGPGMANYFAEVLKRKKVVVLDDTGAYGVGMANAFAAEAPKRGMQVVIRDRVDPMNADYSAVLTRAKSLDVDALYYGGDPLAGIKVVKQSYDIIPKVIKAGGDGVYGAEILKGAGFPAAQGWYATTASPDMVDNPDAAPMVERFKKKYGVNPDNYSITAYDGALVILDAVKRVAASGKPVTREAVRDAIQDSHTKTLQGEVSFDANGDIANRVVSVYQITHNDKYPADDVLHQYKYIGVAPASA
jgi:branched-chain amino acid transport system substrate-binding protein